MLEELFLLFDCCCFPFICEAPVELRLLFSSTRNVMNSESEVIGSSIKYDESKKMRVQMMMLSLATHLFYFCPALCIA